MFRKASRELRYLSVVNWQLRQRCLPFLFAHINLCYKEEKLERLAKEVEIISGITKIKTYEKFCPNSNGFFMCDNINDNFSLLEAILAPPTESMDNVDLSKVVLKQAHTSSDGCFTPHLEKCLSHGMKLALLELNERDLLDTKSQIGRTYSGLETAYIAVFNSSSNSPHCRPAQAPCCPPALSRPHENGKVFVWHNDCPMPKHYAIVGKANAERGMSRIREGVLQEIPAILKNVVEMVHKKEEEYKVE
ncbi:hypothetical protein FB446DRAFT_773202 [Lentinula raphanica]|nr:hypothetical protein FB446DRAFT_773202 [Lentinula raphanica]